MVKTLVDFDFLSGMLPAGATLTRASTGWYVDASGALQSALTDAARFTHDATTAAALGLMVEPGATNSIANASAGGASAGTPGTYPTGWASTGTGTSLSRQIVGTGTEDGIPYIDVRYSGTATAGASVGPGFSTTMAIAASQGQTWIASAFVRLVGGSLSNVTPSLNLAERNGAGAQTSVGTLSLAPSGSPLRQQRFDRSRTLVDATTAYVQASVVFNYTVGQPINVTLRIGLPQLVRASNATSPIVTTSGAVARAGDTLALSLDDGTYTIIRTRSSGTATSKETVSGGSYTVSQSSSPLQSVRALLDLSAALAVSEAPDRVAIGLAPGWPATLPLPTLQGYGFNPASAVDRRPMEIGAPRAYRRTRRPTIDVPVAWQLDAQQQAQLDGFQASTLKEGEHAFGITLAFPSGLALAVARFKDKLAIKGRGGQRWQTTATLELFDRPVMSEAELTALLGDAGDPPAWPEDLLPQPTLDSWELTPKPATVRTDDLPGLPRQRQRSRNSTTEVAARWELSADQAALFDAFFRWRGRDGAQWFDFPLVQAIGTVDTKVRFLGEADWTPRGAGRWSVVAPIEIRERAVLRDDLATGGVERALAFLRQQQQPRTAFASSVLTPDDPAIDRHSTGNWTGVFSMPAASGPAYTPILLTGPQFFPIVAGAPATFQGKVDVPFYSMEGYEGRRSMVNPDPPPDFILDPDTVYADGGTNWGAFFVVGAVDGATQFVAPTASNTTWSAEVADPPAGSWSFQLVTYANQADADADTDRILVGNPWLESERPGDVRTWYGLSYVEAAPQFTAVTLSEGAPSEIAGTLAAFTPVGGRDYAILVTNEADVEYAWAIEPVAAAGSFTIERPRPFQGKIKLRLVERIDGCAVRVVGPVWAEENAAAGGSVYPDLRLEYRAITDLVPAIPSRTVPARRDLTWSIALTAETIGRVSLVDINTKRIYGQHTMPSGLLISFIVPPSGAGQTPAQVYYDQFNDTCFLYDQAVALIAFLQAGQQEPARRLLDALLVVQNADGSYPFASDQAAIEGHNDGFIRNGAVAWVCYALLLADLPAYRGWWPTRPTAAAKRTLAFLMGYTNALGTVNGGKGQYVDDVLDPDYVIPWWSTEHNIDTWWCLDLADQLYGSKKVDYRAAADAMKAAMLTPGMGWDATDGIFWQGGTVVAGVNTPDGMHALDTHTWGAALLYKWGRTADAAVSLDRAFDLYAVRDEATGLEGLTTFIEADGYPPETVPAVWYEGSFGGAVALRLKDGRAASKFLAKLMRGQRADGSFLYALREDAVNDIHPWPCVIAPAWSVLAASRPDGLWPQIFWT